MWIWMPNWNNDSERRIKERHDGSTCQTKNEQWLWTPKIDESGSEGQSKDMHIWTPNWNNGSERHN